MRRLNFKNLKVWNKGMDIVDLAYKFCEDLPSTEKFNLISQIIRSACSIPTNIAEGSGKTSNKDYARFLEIALASSYELETYLLICQRRNYGKNDLLDKILMELEEEQKMIYSYQAKIGSS